MSKKTKATPLHFQAGGRERSKSCRSKQANNRRASPHHEPTTHRNYRNPSTEEDPSAQNRSLEKQEPLVKERSYPTNSSLYSCDSNIFSIIQTGITKKRSPFNIKNWIACVLTLDGRDKFTKVIQYSSRLLAWYLAGLSASLPSSAVDAATATPPRSSTLLVKFNLLQTILTTPHLRKQLYGALSKRFSSLYKSIAEARKAFRMGRSVIEMEKLRSMGWGEYLGYVMSHPLEGGVAGGDSGMIAAIARRRAAARAVGVHNNIGLQIDEVDLDKRNALKKYQEQSFHSIPEGENEDEDNDHDHTSGICGDDVEDESSWNDEESIEEEKKWDPPSPRANAKTKIISRPGRPKLPSRISSNVGWGPSTASATMSMPSSSSGPNSATADSSNQNSKTLPPRTLTEMGGTYRQFPSQSSASFDTDVKAQSITEAALQQTSLPAMISPVPPKPLTPTWKLLGGTFKLIGLMGFWAFDNLSFLTSAGFLDPIDIFPKPKMSPSSITTTPASSGGTGETAAASALALANRAKRTARATEWAVRFYFMGCCAGLYMNSREIIRHYYGALREARAKLKLAFIGNTLPSAPGDAINTEDQKQIQELQTKLKQTESKHFELLLALLKSICDVMVFGNNPGVNLFLKLRGKKNHEGLHCVGGLISAGTVLYNNFPNAH